MEEFRRRLAEDGFDYLDHDTPDADLDALRQIVTGLQPVSLLRRCVEVGSWVGLTARLLSEMVDRLYCVDTFEGTPTDRIGEVGAKYGKRYVFETFCKNMGCLLHFKVHPLVGRSTEFADTWPPDFKLDLIFIDAAHDYPSVLEDILAWYPLLRKGGIMCGHDYCDGFPGVAQAVHEAFPDKAHGVVAGSSVWYHQKVK